jgi:hypothetical protein
LRIQRLQAEVQNQGDCPSNTTVSNLDVIATLGAFDITIDGHLIDIGTVIKARGTISTFRGSRQLDLERVSVIKSTQEETQFWKKIGEFRGRVSEPWKLTALEVQRIQRAMDETKRKEEAKSRRKQRRETQRAKQLARGRAERETQERVQDKLLQREAEGLAGNPLI